MTIQTTVIVGFAALMFVGWLVARNKWKNATLEKIGLMPGEKILLEEANIKIVSCTSPRTVIFPRSVIRLTNQRIMIAQKPLFGSGTGLRFVVQYNSKSELPTGYGGGALQNGFVTFGLLKNGIKIGEDKKAKYLELVPDEKSGYMNALPNFVRIYSTKISEYLNIIK